MEIYGIEIGIPPYSKLYGTFITLTNFNVLSTGTGYNASFKGSLSYYSD